MTLVSENIRSSHALRELSPDARLVVQMLSVQHLATPIGQLRAYLEGLGRTVSEAQLKVTLDDLERRGWVQPVAAGYRCHPDAQERAARSALREGRMRDLLRQANRPVLARLQPQRRSRIGGRHVSPQDDLLRGLRHALYAGREREIRGAMEAYSRVLGWTRLAQALWDVGMRPFDGEWLTGLPAAIADEIAGELAIEATLRGDAAADLFGWIRGRVRSGKAHGELRILLADRWILEGRLDEAHALVRGYETAAAGGVRGWLAVLRGDDAEAIREYEAGLTLLRQSSGDRNTAFSHAYGPYYSLGLIRAGRPLDAQRFLERALWDRDNAQRDAYQIAYDVARRLANPDDSTEVRVPTLEGRHPALAFMLFLGFSWTRSDAALHLAAPLEAALQRAEQCGHRWLAAECAALLGTLTASATLLERAAQEHAHLGTRTLVDAAPVLSPWERSLAALEAAVTSAPAPADKQLIWLVTSPDQRSQLHFEAKEQTRKGDGWTAGRIIQGSNLRYTVRSMEHATEADRAIGEALYSGSDCYYMTLERAVRALRHMVGHPRVFWKESPTRRVEVVFERPRLRIEPVPGGFAVRVDPMPPPAAACVIQRQDDSMRVVEFNQDEQRLARTVGAGFVVPKNAQGRVMRLAGAAVEQIEVEAELGELEIVAADARPRVALAPAGEGLEGKVWVRPLGASGPAVGPGTGARCVVGDVDGRAVKAERDPDAERAGLEALWEACPTLPRSPAWTVAEIETCLVLLEELRAAGADVEWPQGARLDVSAPVDWDAVAARVGSDGEWFTVGGSVRVDEERVLELRQILLLRGSSRGRFVPLGNGKFLALTETFRRRLDDLREFSTGKEIRFHRLAAPALEEALADVDDAGSFRDHLKALTEAPTFAIPSTLQAELRDYQRDGVSWLARLAHWGAGACLADDMGLGKTVQALALLLQRAPQGPALVVAPTSVCANWREEARRFAPSLSVRTYAGKERHLEDVGPFTVIVTSYTLLHQDEAALTAVPWHTVVLDEAQAIKNATTRRSQAAMRLRAGFRMLTTGTPVENHLGELWNLFRFINPGLLGSREQFDRRFAHPIERAADRAARGRLKRLVAPFILRRTKTQVLQELPARTEITLHVELSAEERAVYEALRRSAVASLQEVEGEQGRLQILAELMKLRRACCHPRLVMEGATPDGSKLEAFGELLEELLENQHKALVFSQFVDHLAIVRERLDAQGVTYQYLDGSTPMAERARRVAAFQAGEGDVFLISLRAGGTGLNLTAADYVIHLDPWWNPAVEDQASDRAHRIGQQRPVTVYRLVTRDTVEERIVALHHRKRDLADSLLEGSDAASRISAQDLLALLREG